MFSDVIRIADPCAMDLLSGGRTQKLLKTFAIRSAIFNIRCQRNMQRKHSDCCGNRRRLSNTKESPAGIRSRMPAGDFLYQLSSVIDEVEDHGDAEDRARSVCPKKRMALAHHFACQPGYFLETARSFRRWGHGLAVKISLIKGCGNCAAGPHRIPRQPQPPPASQHTLIC